MGVMMAIFLFSMVGIPPFAGFIGKYRVFAAAVDEGLIGLVIIGVLASAASVYYYLRPLVHLYMKEKRIRHLSDSARFYVFRSSAGPCCAYPLFWNSARRTR